jgi:hypothetical protein
VPARAVCRVQRPRAGVAVRGLRRWARGEPLVPTLRSPSLSSPTISGTTPDPLLLPLGVDRRLSVGCLLVGRGHEWCDGIVTGERACSSFSLSRRAAVGSGARGERGHLDALSPGAGDPGGAVRDRLRFARARECAKALQEPGLARQARRSLPQRRAAR